MIVCGLRTLRCLQHSHLGIGCKLAKVLTLPRTNEAAVGISGSSLGVGECGGTCGGGDSGGERGEVTGDDGDEEDMLGRSILCSGDTIGR